VAEFAVDTSFYSMTLSSFIFMVWSKLATVNNVTEHELSK